MVLLNMIKKRIISFEMLLNYMTDSICNTTKPMRQVHGAGFSVKVTNCSVRMKKTVPVACPHCFLQIRGRCPMLPSLTKLREFWSISWPKVMVAVTKGGQCHHWQVILDGCLARNSSGYTVGSLPVQLLLQNNHAVQLMLFNT